jgi:hypothetical protein
MKNAAFCDVTVCGFFRADFSEERIASIIRVKRIGELGKTSALTGNRRKLRRNTNYDDGGATFLRNVGSYKKHMA